MADMEHYIGNAEVFPILRKWDFFNHAAVSPLPKPAADALRAYAEQAASETYLAGTWYRDIERLRVLSAGLLNCHRDEIAFVKNTGEGLSIVASGIDWKAGDRIVTTAVEYPANVYPWMEQCRRHGCELVMLPEETDENGRRQVPLKSILREIEHPKTRLVTLSHVEYASGQRHDMETIGAACRQHGKLFCVDAIQSVGVLPVDVQSMHIDFLSADSHKWMLGPEGAGLFYCRRELIDSLRPLTIGWMNVVNAMDYGHYDYTLKPDAGRYECGTYDVVGLHAMKGALDVLADAGIDAIARRVRELGDYLIVRLEEKGYQIISPRAAEQWSGIVSFISPVHPHEPIVARIRKERRIEISLRERRLRCSPHFYNTEDQLNRLVEALPGHR